jgi:integrase
MSAPKSTGIVIRHGVKCGTRSGGPCSCSCSPSFTAAACDARTGKRICKTFSTLTEAKHWREDTRVELRAGVRRGPSGLTVRHAADEWLAGAKTGAITNRSGERYEPSTLRSYESCLRDRIIPELGALRLEDVDRRTLARHIERLIGEGLDPSTIHGILMPLRVVYRRAVSHELMASSPLDGHQLPAVRGRRERIASPAEAEALLAALPARDRAI